MPETTFQIYLADTKAQAAYPAGQPQPQVLMETPDFKVVLVGLEAGAHIPLHPEAASMYHFLEGEGLMTVGAESFAVKPGVTVLVPNGEKRGINARTRLSFIGSKGGQ